MLSPDQGSPLALPELPAARPACDPALKAAVQAKFIDTMFHMTRVLSMPGAQWLAPLTVGVFSVFSYSFLFLCFSSVLSCTRPRVGDLWLVVWCFHATRAIPSRFLPFALASLAQCCQLFLPAACATVTSRCLFAGFH